jgi:hypothetical protein
MGSYPAYVGKVMKPDCLSTESIRQLFGSGPVQSFRSAYRRRLEQMASLGKWEEGWKESIKASVLHAYLLQHLNSLLDREPRFHSVNTSAALPRFRRQ